MNYLYQHYLVSSVGHHGYYNPTLLIPYYIPRLALDSNGSEKKLSMKTC